MALFKRKGDDDAARPAPAESIEAMRRRARHRLIGAAVLVLVGVVGFPLLFDTQPRPIAVDIAIEIPDRNKMRPLDMPVAPSPASRASGAGTEMRKAAPSASVPAAVIVPPSAKPEEKTATQRASAASVAINSVASVESKAAPRAEPRSAGPAVPPPDDGAKARSLLDGKPVDTDAARPADTVVAGAGRFVVQVGAFADDDRARDARGKLEKAGLKTYTHVADTKEGKRTRVRVGPFASRAEADRAAERIKALDLPAAILTL